MRCTTCPSLVFRSVFVDLKFMGAVSGLVVGSIVGPAHAQPCQVLGTLGGATSQGRDVSDDGRVVVGFSHIAGNSTTHAFRWTASGGMQDLGTLVGGNQSVAHGVSGDGLVVVGVAANAASVLRAFRWTASGGMQDLGALGGNASVAYDASADGSAIVGSAETAAGQLRAFRWTASGGMQDLGTLGGTISEGFSISADGLVIVGGSNNAAEKGRAFHWILGFGMGDLGTLGGNSGTSRAFGVSGDGSVIVGQTSTNGGLDHRAFRWTPAEGLQSLGTLPGGNISIAQGVSANGQVIVGNSTIPGSLNRPFRWTASEGMQDLGTLPGSFTDPIHGASADGAVIVGDANAPATPTHAGIWGACDQDGDGLSDDWEINGIPYAKASGGVGHYLLPAADVLRKDLFVEVDAMTGLDPAPATIDLVIDAFDIAPVPAAPGLPGGLGGVALHVIIDDTDLDQKPYPNGFVEFQEDKDAWFGTSEERADPDAAAILDAKRKAYRYCIFADSHSGGSSSGMAEGGGAGDDFMVTLGSNWSPVGGTDFEQAGTFMHELGHTLGLGHGGGDIINYKPNYYSIMNYLWQLPTSYGPTGGGYLLLYSDLAWPTLQEDQLHEVDGIGGDVSLPIPFVSPPPSGGSGTCLLALGANCVGYALSQGPVDWNNDGNATTPGTLSDTMNINGFPGDCPDPCSRSPTKQALVGHDDWSNLIYDFRGSLYYAAGAVAPSGPPEMDLAAYQFLKSIPPPPINCYADCDADGTLTIDDFICFQTYFALGDPYADCDGDATLSIDDFICFQTFFAIGC